MNQKTASHDADRTTYKYWSVRLCVLDRHGVRARIQLYGPVSCARLSLQPLKLIDDCDTGTKWKEVAQRATQCIDRETGME